MAETIGILGGTFHPVHNGHVKMARIALEENAVSRVWFMPDGQPPHKSLGSVTAVERLEMVRLAVEREENCFVTDREVNRTGYTYTVDTMTALRDEYPAYRFVQIIGGDTLLELENWKSFDRVAELCSFFVVPREGIDGEKMEKCAAKLKKKFGAKIRISKRRSVDISSTKLRGMIENGEPWEGFVPDAVAAYIREKHLYESSESGQFDRIADQVRAALPLKRWHHTLGVVETAQLLAERFDVDPERARLAAILHDCAKAYHGKEAEAVVSNYKIELDPETKKNPKLWHGPMGAVLAKEVYGVDDPEILNAIRIHTVGAAGMTKLEKVVKLADLMEPGRDYEGVAEIRRLAEEDLDRALLFAMKGTSRYLEGESNMHPDSLLAIRDLEQIVHNKSEHQ